MDHKRPFMSSPHQKRDERLWWLVGVVLLLMISCLSLVIINAKDGFVVDGRVHRYRFESMILSEPICKDKVPCLATLVPRRNHFHIWLVTEIPGPIDFKRFPIKGYEMYLQEIIDIPLLW